MRAMQAGRIPNAPLRVAVLDALAGEWTWSKLCYEIGWVNGPTGKAETAGLKRCLGIEAMRYRSRKDGTVNASYVSSIKLERAKAICKAIGVDLDELYEGKMPAEPIAGLCEECDAPMLKPAPDGLCGLCAEELALFGRIAVAA